VALRIDDMEMLDEEGIRQWRRSKPDGATRFVGPAFPRPGGLDDPDEPLNPLSDGDSYDGSNVSLRVEPGTKGRLTPREAVEAYTKLLLKWAKADRAWYLHRARILRTTAPLQFAHLTDDQLADALYNTVVEKARAGVERTYKMNGWVRPGDLDRQRSVRPANGGAILLPGQKGRGR